VEVSQYSQSPAAGWFSTLPWYLRSGRRGILKPPSNVKTPAQYIASLSADRAKTITMVRALVNKHIPRGYDECLVWGTIGWTIPLSRYPDTHNKQPIYYVGL
jgi:hypothetical protein